MGTYPVQLGKQTYKQLAKITIFGYLFRDVFEDFVELSLAGMLSLTANLSKQPFEQFFNSFVENQLSGEYEDRYRRVMARYDRENVTRACGSRPADFFAYAFGALQLESEGGKDVLGELYETQVCTGDHGQFFTPMALVQVLNLCLPPQEGDESMIEPACGSGRMIIERAKMQPDLLYKGIDVSPVCARMTALNMVLHQIKADIYQGNALSGEVSYLWRIRDGWIWEYKPASKQQVAA